MKRYHPFRWIITLLTALSIIGAVGVSTAFAAPTDEVNYGTWYDGVRDIYDYYFGDDDDENPNYEEPTYLDELPTVSDGQVTGATAVAVPAAAESEATLVSGIVMWLCVALGIAVLVGVMVSKRTHRRG